MRLLGQSVMLVLACSVFLIYKISYADEKIPTDRTKPQDRVTVPKAKGVPEGYFDLFSNHQAGILLSQYLKTSVDFSEGAPKRHRMALKAIREAANDIQKKFIPELIKAYGRLPETDYDRRLLVIDTIALLGKTESLEFLSRTVLSAVPERKKPGRPFDAVENEVVIRLAAVQGVSTLAAKKYSLAEKKLIEFAKNSPVKAIKIEAIQGYLNAPLWEMRPRSYESFKETKVYKQRLSVLKKSLPAKIYELTQIKILTQADMKKNDKKVDKK